jgi:signal transduction histidine kinase
MQVVKRLTPFAVLVLTALVALAAASAALVVALDRPWLGLTLSVDGRYDFVRIDAVAPDGPARSLPPGLPLVRIGGIALETGDLVEEPDVAESYAALKRFLERQSELHAALAQPDVTLETGGASAVQIVVTPAPRRPVASLPPVFWVQIATGLVSMMVGAWVWSLRRGELSAGLLALAGAGVLVSAFPAAVYSSREIAVPDGLFRALSAINHFGALVFGVAMVALFLTYPRRLLPVRALWLLPVVYGTIWAMDTGWIGFPGPAEGYHLPTVTLMIGIMLGAFLQYRASRDDPAARAAIRWFALSVGLCAGTFVTVVLMPNLFGMRPSVSQGYAFVLFGMLFLGVAAGVARYRLFELEGWAFSILSSFGAVTLLVLFDAALISFVAMDRPAAFALSLLVVALVYLPCRDWLARRLMPRREIDRKELFGRIVDIALTRDDAQESRWRQVLQDAFRPLHMSGWAKEAPKEPAVVEDGLTLLLPGISGLPPLSLSYAHSGRRLFSPHDRRFAAEICAMLAHAIASRNAQLLSALHSETSERKDTLIRETISDLRDIVNNAARGGKTIEELLADLKVEALERLAAADIRLDWRDACEDGSVTLAPNVAHSLRSVLREIVSTTIRHSGAGTMRVRFETRDGIAHLDLSDDGRGLVADRQGKGNGLSNIEARLMALRGTLVFADAGPGLVVRARFPLNEGGPE